MAALGQESITDGAAAIVLAAVYGLTTKKIRRAFNTKAGGVVDIYMQAG